MAFSKNAQYSFFISHSEEQRQTLHDYFIKRFSYYKNLSPKKQLKFLYRVEIIKKANRIKIDDDIRHADEDIELMVSAAFTQITFGFTNFEITSFSRIIIYPDSFFSKLIGAHVNGLTIGNGYLFLSWNHFLKGYQTNDDKINLALHELAHALYIDRFHYRRDIKWLLWQKKAEQIFEELQQQDEIKYFREYAKTNMAEFWAVTIECFFEDPVNFKRTYPELYIATARVLKQDLLKNLD
jgi:Mlc titration factor MtfA (ptsG expression regulator)